MFEISKFHLHTTKKVQFIVIMRFYFMLSEEDIWSQSEHINLPFTEIILRNLEEDTLYRIRGIAKEKERQSISDEIKVRSLRRVTITHLSQGSLISKFYGIIS